MNMPNQFRKLLQNAGNFCFVNSFKLVGDLNISAGIYYTLQIRIDLMVKNVFAPKSSFIVDIK